MKDNLLTLLVFVGWVVVVAISTWPRLWRLVLFFSSSSWPIMPAIVEQVVVSSYSGRSGIARYRGEVAYSYQVTGEYYGGRYMVNLLLEADVDDFFRRFPKGANVQIRVNPAKPQASVLAS